MYHIDYSPVKRYDVVMHRNFHRYNELVTKVFTVDVDVHDVLPQVRDLMDSLVHLEATAHLMYDSLRQVILSQAPPPSNG